MQQGAFTTLYAQDDIYAFARILDNTVAIILINRGNTTNTDIPLLSLGLNQGNIQALLDDETIHFTNSQLKLTLKEKSSFIGLVTS